eukprot:UN22856
MTPDGSYDGEGASFTSLRSTRHRKTGFLYKYGKEGSRKGKRKWVLFYVENEHLTFLYDDRPLEAKEVGPHDKYIVQKVMTVDDFYKDLDPKKRKLSKAESQVSFLVVVIKSAKNDENVMNMQRNRKNICL